MNRLKELRKENKLTLYQIEEKTGINRGTYSNYENGITNPKFEIWKKLADYFDVPIDYLMGVEHFARKYELWSCSKCRKHFFVTEDSKHCPYCGSTKQLGYGTSKTISF